MHALEVGHIWLKYVGFYKCIFIFKNCMHYMMRLYLI
jgi:hypothetical protein